ncbi:MAG TPA: hypothetical protein VHF25_11180, partial [Nitriliruptorales bacterium]|nr:hypothetical protein [Nitriliruptorales bacterium]
PAAVAWGVTAVLTVVAVAVGLAHLRSTSPHTELDLVAPGISDLRGDEATLVTCQRTLPDRPTPVAGGERPSQPLGLVRSSEVVACPENFDPRGRGGPPVQFLGEVVGDVLQRDGGAWVLMNDDVYALEHGPLPAHEQLSGSNTGLAAWLPTDVIDLDRLRPGRPNRRGDVLLVVGAIHRADPADGGGLTLRAVHAEVVAAAEAAPQPLHLRQAVAAGALVVLALLATFYERRKHRGR